MVNLLIGDFFVFRNDYVFEIDYEKEFLLIEINSYYKVVIWLFYFDVLKI